MDKIAIPVFEPAVEEAPVYKDYRGYSVEICRTTATQHLMDTIQWGLDFIVTDSPIVSAPLLTIVKDFCILQAFTNLDMKEISFLKDVNQIYRVYDLVVDLADEIKPLVSERQLSFLVNGLSKMGNAIIEYRRSAAGILESLTGQAKDSTNAFNESIALLQDAEGLQNIKGLLDVMNKLDSPQN